MKFSVLIATFGSAEWEHLGRERAAASASDQGADEVIVYHDREGTIASTRNCAAENASGDMLIFLDGDDELAPGYVQAMRNKARDEKAMYVPRISYVNPGRRPQPPRYWPEIPLSMGNWLVIGTAVPRRDFLDTGGFSDEHPLYEDWELFAKLWKTGLQPVKVRQAVYVAHRNPDGRNQSGDAKLRVRTHYNIGRQLFPDEYPPEWLSKRR